MYRVRESLWGRCILQRFENGSWTDVLFCHAPVEITAKETITERELKEYYRDE